MELPAAQFRVRFFELIDTIAASGEEVVITRHGRPLVRVVPEVVAPTRRHGCMAGTAELLGDLEEPVLPPIDAWGGDDPA